MSEPGPLAPIHVIGGGLAGGEPASQIALQNVPFVLHGMLPARATQAHRTGDENHLEVKKTAAWIIGLIPTMRTAEGPFRKGRPRPP